MRILFKSILLFILVNGLYAQSPLWPTDGWIFSQPKDMGFNSEHFDSLDKKLSTEYQHIRSFLVSYKGKLVFEKYGQGYSKDDFHQVCSVTKSITSALIGIALERGLISDLDCRLFDFFPEYESDSIDPLFRKIRLRHLLTMSPGFNINDTPLFDQWHTNANPTRFTFNLKVENQPGNELKYNDPAIHLLSVIIKKVSRKRTIDFAEEYLYSKLGIEIPDWQRDPQGNNWGNFRSSYRPRDLLKFGYLYLNGGKWKDEIIIPNEFVKASTQKQITGEMFGFKMNFGYLWYIGNFSGVKTFNASGYGGQYIYVIPEMDMVVVCTSDVDRHHGENYSLIPTFIIPLKDEM